MAKYLPLPDGTSVTIREGETPAQAWARAQQMYPEAFGAAAPSPSQTAQSGFVPAFKSGVSELKSGLAALAGRTGIMDQGAAEDYIRQQQEYQQKTYKPTATFGEAPVTKTLELLGGSIPYMAAPLVAGTAVAAAPLTGAAATLAGLGAAGAASATQFTGANLRRQMEEGKTLGETELGAAAMAAVPQAALDTLSLKMMPGIRNIFTAAGKEVSKDAAKAIAQQGIKEVAKDYALATGKTMGVEGTTEAAQQVLERLQAGLNITDEKARAEYFDSFLGGAVLGGVLSPAGRYVERRGEAKEQEAERLQKAMAERRVEEQKRAEEAAFRASPEGALQFAQDYEARQARFNELKDVKKPGKDASPLEQADFLEIKKEREDLRKSLFKDSSEYKEAKATAAQLLEQQRVEKLTPEEYMLESMGMAPKAPAAAATATPPKMRTVVDEMGRISEVPEGAEEAEAPSAAQQYLAGQIQAARESGQLSLADYADYAMQDPKMAAEIVQTRTKMPDLTTTENNTLLSAINLRLKDVEKQRAAATRAEFEQRAADLRAQQPTPEITNQLSELEQYLAETAEKGPSYVEPTFDYLAPLFEKALSGNEVIKVSDAVRPTDRAPAIRERVESLLQEADQADKDYQAARANRQPDAALAARKRGTDAIAQIEALSKEGNVYSKEFLAARKLQNEAVAALDDVTEQLRTQRVLGKEFTLDEEGRVTPATVGKGLAASTQQSLMNKAAELRAQLITNVLQEAALHRRAAGQPAITQDEAVVAASKLYDTINTWVERSAAEPAYPEFEEVIVEPAQMRGTEIVRPAKTERRMVQPGVKTISPAERAHFKSRIDAIRTQLGAPAEGKARKVDTGVLRQQFQTTEAKKVAEARGETAETLGGELRRRAEYVSNLLEKAIPRAPEGGTFEYTDADGNQIVEQALALRDTLKQAKDMIEDGKISRDFLDAAENVANRVLSGAMQETVTRTQRVQTTPGKRVVENVPGKEASTRFGTRGARFTTMGVEEDQKTESVINQNAVRELEEAMSAFGPTAQEQKEAGQKQLDLLFEAPGERTRLAETDLGYIRMTPQAFANSPKIKKVWEALDKLRASLKRKAAKDNTVKQRNQAAAQTLNRLKAAVDNIKNDTKFFWADTAKWTDEKLAKAYAGYPDVGNTPEEQKLVDTYLKGTDEDRKAFTPEQKQELEKLFRNFRENKMPEYQKRVAEAMKLLAQGQRLDDIDNQLLQTMQDANKSIADAAKKQREELAVLREAIKQIKSLAKAEKATPLTKRAEALQRQAEIARSKYNERVEQLFKDAMKRMDDALAEILDPEIKKAREDIEAAEKVLAQEKAELQKIPEQLKAVQMLYKGEKRDRLATSVMFNYEEKLSIVQDLEKQIAKAKESLDEDLDTRMNAHDQAAAVLEAVTDKKVQAFRDRVIGLEQQIATLRGEGVMATAAGEGGLPTLRYPFAAQKYEADLKAAQASLKAVEKQQTEVREQVKSQAQQMEDFWADKLGGMGRRHELATSARNALHKIADQMEALDVKIGDLQTEMAAKKKPTAAQTKKLEALQTERAELEKERTRLLMQTTPTVTTKEKQLEKLRREQRERDDRAYAAEEKALAKEMQLQSIDEEVAGLIEELGAFEEFPNELAALKRMSEDETLDQKERSAALAKAGIIQNIESLEAQREVLLEGKPAKKRRPATTETTAAAAARKPFRTGYMKDLERASEGLKAEREGGVYGELGEEAPDLRGLFRTAEGGKGMTADAVQKVADEVRKDWKVVPPIVVIQSEKGLPIRIYRQMLAQQMHGKAPGLYDPKTNKVYLIADNLHNNKDVALTVAHEVAGHFGLREMLGKEYVKTMTDLYAGNEAVRIAADGKMDADKSLTREVAVEEVLADMAETGPYANSQLANALRRIMYAVKQALQKLFGITNFTDNEVKQLVANARRYVKTGKGKRGGDVDTSGALFRTKPVYNQGLERVGEDISRIVSQQRNWADKIKANATGLAFETQLVDRFAAFERLRKYMEPYKGDQMMYYLRMYDQRMNFVSQAVGRGAPQLVEKTRADGTKEFLIESQEGASIANVVKTLADAQPYVGNSEAVNQLFTTYLAALRAKRVGLAALNFGGTITQDMLDRAVATVNGNADLKAVFEKARDEYNAFNRNMIDFVAKTGALSKELAQRLSATNDYIPFYRERNGVAELIIGGESPIRIGSIAEQPYLQELVGGDQPILDFMTSSVQNVNMLSDMALRNLATRNAVLELVDIGAAKIVKAAEGKDVVKFKIDGKDRYAIITSEKVKIGNQEFDTGVPADILVKGMEGIPTQMPALLRVMAMPSQLLRKAVTLSPLYMARQLFRDSLAAPLLSGADFTPVLGALKQINSATKDVLERRGVTGGQQFQGGAEDLTKILRDLSTGKPGWQAALGKLEAASMEADALTRRAQYNSYIKQGMSEMQATLMALESMNFNKRGASPSVHMANAMIPFFNAQIQGLNVLYKALMGKMPGNDQLKIRQKLLTRGAMMAAATLVYAMLMEDDEAYQNAQPDQKYGNWFVRVPGVEEPVRIPIPFEIGYIFKAIPEAVYNSMRSEHGKEEAFKAFRQILINTIPGGSNYGIPQFFKPAIEAGLGKSFFTGRDILSAREKDLLPEEQFRANTSELAKALGKQLGFSPIVFENLVRGYTGTMGLAFLHAISVGMPKSESPEAAVKRLSEYPIVGGAFQPNDAGGIINNVYERFNEDIKVRDTYKKMLAEGRTAEANELLQRRGNEIVEAELGDKFKTAMNKLTQAERAIQASNMSPEQKREQLDAIRKLKTAYAKTAREVGDKTILLSSPL